MKSTLPCPTTARAHGATIAVGRLLSELSVQTGFRQAANPAKRGARLEHASRTALRQTEGAVVEESALPAAKVRIVNATPIPVPWRLVGRSENSFFAVLAFLAIGTVGYELWITYQNAGDWQNFVQFVRQLLV